MTSRAAQFHALYKKLRITDQLKYYDQRRREYEKAHQQAIVVRNILLVLAALAGVAGQFVTGTGRAWAGVIAALLAIGQLGLPLRVTGLVPCAENHVSGSALRPGDVVRHVGGTTTEVTNTDAEGRLVLADALAHAVRTLHPSTLVDVATLTGAMKVSLGVRTGGLFATEPELAERIRAAGETVGEAWWPMPLVADHVDGVRSDLADLRQCPPGPGGITAALFLREFTAGLPWAHLDIAGPARAEQDYDEVNAGGTGFATRTLIELACSFTGRAPCR